jgi:hypothetical protein
MDGITRLIGWRFGLVVPIVLSGTLIATRSDAITPTYDLNGSWSVTLKDAACEGSNQGPYPMNVTGFNKSTGDFNWSFHSGVSTGTGVESGSDVIFNSFGGEGNPDLTATASHDNGVLTLTSQIGECQNNGGVNEWIFTFGGDLVVDSTLHTVNSTEARDGVCNADPGSSPPVCTLAQALAVSNYEGGDTIRFAIPHKDGNTFEGSVPEIDVPINQVLEVNAPTTIDASTQPGGRVELSGFAISNVKGPITRGLYVTVGGAGSTVLGMVINGFNDQIQLVGGGNTIQDDWFMTNAQGTESDWNPLVASLLQGQYAQIGIDLESSGNQIGGTDSGQGNLFALSWSSRPGPGAQTRVVGAIYDGGQSLGPNVIQGNDIGIKPGAISSLIEEKIPGMPDDFQPEPGLDLSGGQTIGGPGAGAGNRVAGAIISGPSILQGNDFFGQVSVSGAATIGGAVASPGTAPGNAFNPLAQSSTISDELTIANSNAVTQGNLFRDTDHISVAAGVSLDVSGATLGGPLESDANLFTGLDVQHGAVWLFDDSDVVQNDSFIKNSGAAVQVSSGSGNRVTQVSMSANRLGIELGEDGYVYNPREFVNPTGPNGGEPYPNLLSDQVTASDTTVTGSVSQSGTLIIDLYAQATCASPGNEPGQGFVLVGSQNLTSVIGSLDFSLVYKPLPPGMDAITMTATGSDGSTSEFSPCLEMDSKAPSLLGAGVAPTLSRVPVKLSGATASLSQRLQQRATSLGGDATIELLCPGGAQSPCTGSATLTIPGGNYHNATLARTSFTMPAGTVSPFDVQFNRKIYSTLRKFRRLTTRLTTSASDASGDHVSKSFTVTFVYAKTK